MKLTQKFILWFILISSLIAVSGFYAIFITRQAMKTAFIASCESLAIDLIDGIDRSTHKKIEIFKAYLADRLLRETLSKSNREFAGMDNIPSYIIQKDREWTSVSREEVTPFMRNIMDNRLSRELYNKIKFYENSHGFRMFGEVFVTNKYGANVAQTGKTTDYRQDDEQWWQVAKNEGFYVRDVQFDESAEVDSTDVGMRVEDADGHFIGVMKVIISTEEITRILDKAGEYGVHGKHLYMEVRLLTSDGRLIYSNRKEEKMGTDFSLLLTGPDHLSPGAGHAQTNGAAHYIYKKNGRTIISVHAHSVGYEDYGGLGWILVLGHYEDDIMTSSVILSNRLESIFAAVIIMIILSGRLMPGSVIKAVRQLRDAFLKIGKGDMDISVQVKSNDEIGDLCTSFNQMSNALRQSTSERDRLVAELRTLSMIDELTGLYNRRGFFYAADLQLKRAKRSGEKAFLLYLDLDRFKEINDKFGHQEGDNTLKDMAAVLNAACRESDTIGRIGGDEFIVLSTGTNEATSKIIIDRIQESIDRHNKKRDKNYDLSVSIGVAEHDLQTPYSLHDLISTTDLQMYVKKKRKYTGQNGSSGNMPS